MVVVNKQVRLASRPTGLPRAEDFSYTEEPVASPGPGELLVRVLDISLDPAMRGWMREGRSYIEPVAIGDVMRALAVGEVLACERPEFSPGQFVVGWFGVQEYACGDGTKVRAVDASKASLPTYLGSLGVTGMTAYFGLLDVGKPREGDTVVVSGAAGAVGADVGQIARIRGCRVVGIAGGPEKCRQLTEELGFDVAIDYKSEDVPAALRSACPNGIDVYFDNVGGDILDAALSRLARGARVVISGAISQMNRSDRVKGPSNYLNLLVSRASMTGFVVFDYEDRYPEAIDEMASWIDRGLLRVRDDVVTGSVQDFPETLRMLFSGENSGKLVLEIARPAEVGGDGGPLR